MLVAASLAAAHLSDYLGAATFCQEQIGAVCEKTRKYVVTLRAGSYWVLGLTRETLPTKFRAVVSPCFIRLER